MVAAATDPAFADPLDPAYDRHFAELEAEMWDTPALEGDDGSEVGDEGWVSVALRHCFAPQDAVTDRTSESDPDGDDDHSRKAVRHV